MTLKQIERLADMAGEFLAEVHNEFGSPDYLSAAAAVAAMALACVTSTEGRPASVEALIWAGRAELIACASSMMTPKRKPRDKELAALRKMAGLK